MMSIINNMLQAGDLLLKRGTMVDTTIIHTPSSSKKQSTQRDPDMHRTRKASQWYFGTEIHVAVDARSGLAYTVAVAPGNIADVTEFSSLLRDDNRTVFGDKSCLNNLLKQAVRRAAQARIASHNASCHHPITTENRRFNHWMPSTLARADNVFRVIKQ